jgi:hypothetical protein
MSFGVRTRLVFVIPVASDPTIDPACAGPFESDQRELRCLNT